MPTIRLVRDYEGLLQIVYRRSTPHYDIRQKFEYHLQSDVPMPDDTYILIRGSDLPILVTTSTGITQTELFPVPDAMFVLMPRGTVQSKLLSTTIYASITDPLPWTRTVTIQSPNERTRHLPARVGDTRLLVDFPFNSYKVGNPSTITFQIDETLEELNRLANR